MNTINFISDEYECLDFVAMSLFHVPCSIVVSSVRNSYVDVSYSILEEHEFY